MNGCGIALPGAYLVARGDAVVDSARHSNTVGLAIAPVCPVSVLQVQDGMAR